MLSQYKKTYKNTINQILIISKTGEVIDFESALFKNIKTTHISELSPFFNTLIPLLKNPNKSYTFNCVNVESEGKTYTIDSKLHTNSTKEHAIFIFNDLTKQYKEFQKVSQIGNEANLKSQFLDFQNTLILEKDAFRDNFITNFSHELRFPINTIEAFSTLLENTNLEQDQRYNLSIIKNTNTRLKVMLNEILDIAKIKTGHFKLYENTYNILEEFKLIETLYRPLCEAKGLELIVNIHEDCPEYAILDKHRMSQIASNLIGNAIKFTNTGTITLTVKPLEVKDKNLIPIEFTVTDTGIGIPKKQKKHIFETFYQLENNIKNDGYGLGLAITKKIVKALNGKIKVKSEVNKGTTFKVKLNFKAPTNIEPVQKVTKTSQETKDFQYKVLVAEPLAKDKVTILQILNKTKKYDVTIVDTGDDVIDELNKNTFDVLIVNVKMPKMDGIDTALYIRHSKQQQFTKIPIIAVSNTPSKIEEKLCKSKFINSYLGKPYNKQELLRRVKYLTTKKQAI